MSDHAAFGGHLPLLCPRVLAVVACLLLHVTRSESDCKELYEGGLVSMHEFASPRHPHPYPANIDCLRILYAPPGYDIVIRFKEFAVRPSGDSEEEGILTSMAAASNQTIKFIPADSAFLLGQSETIEPSYEEEEVYEGGSENKRCTNDFLEIRDGRYGFSPLIGRFCGVESSEFEIRTQSGFAWIHFHSDDAIEYDGFRANYELVLTAKKLPRNHIECFTQTISLDGVIESTTVREFHELYRGGNGSVDCVWRLEVAATLQIAVFILEFGLAEANRCGENALEIYAGSSTHRPIHRLCGSSVMDPHIFTDSNVAFVRIVASQSSVSKLAISLLYSAYAKGSLNCSNGAMFSCGDDLCIPDLLVCNGRANCVYRIDEIDCRGRTFLAHLIEHYLIPIIFAALLAFGLLTTVICAIRRFKTRRKLFRVVAHRRKMAAMPRPSPVLALLNKKTSLGAPLSVRIPRSSRELDDVRQSSSEISGNCTLDPAGTSAISSVLSRAEVHHRHCSASAILNGWLYRREGSHCSNWLTDSDIAFHRDRRRTRSRETTPAAPRQEIEEGKYDVVEMFDL